MGLRVINYSSKGLSMKFVSHITLNLLLINCFLFTHILSITTIEEKPMVIIIPSYNNQKWVVNNLRSVYKQCYSNYRVIYIDDCSTDSTYELALKTVKELDTHNRTTIIHNKVNRGAMANWYAAIHSCQDQEIIIQLDGDDELAHEHVLQRVNECYTQDIWMTYGQFFQMPIKK